MPPPRPPRQVCPICASDDDLEILLAADEWVMRCEYAGHLPYEWRPTPNQSAVGSYRSGLGVELDVYSDLLACVAPHFCEYGVLEHRYAERAPSAYRFLVDRYGHGALAPSKYTASSFLGGALGQLWREGAIRGVLTKPTGYWSYNATIGTYAGDPTADPADRLTWATFATEQLGVSPHDWPALGYVHQG